MTDPNPIDRLREALGKMGTEIETPEWYEDAQEALAQLETEREADRGRIAELVTALEDNGCELVRCGRLIRELESQLSALRAPETAPVAGELWRAPPEEAPEDTNRWLIRLPIRANGKPAVCFHVWDPDTDGEDMSFGWDWEEVVEGGRVIDLNSLPEPPTEESDDA